MDPNAGRKERTNGNNADGRNLFPHISSRLQNDGS